MTRHRDRSNAPWMLGLALLVILAATVAAAIAFGEEPLRRWLERQINAPLEGYTVALGQLDLHPLTFELELRRVTVTADAAPDPAVARVESIRGGVDWRALLSFSIVARIEVQEPVLRLERAQILRETRDGTPLQEKGWQEAITRVSPLEINDVRVHAGSVTYRDAPDQDPIVVDRIHLRARNVRNVRAEPGTYPSPVELGARVLGEATLDVRGTADFLAEPRPAGAFEFRIEEAPLTRLAPLAERQGVELRSGHLDVRGRLESTARETRVDLETVSIDRLDADYRIGNAAPTPEKEVARQVAQDATRPANESGLRVHVDRIEVVRSTLGVHNVTEAPPYRMFVSIEKATLRDYGNGTRAHDAPFALQGAFMNSGRLDVRGTLHPDSDGPALDVTLELVDLELAELNDLLRAHGQLDVVAGRLSVYSEVGVADRRVAGYVKPLLVDVDVYDRRQDAHAPLLNELYQGVVGGVATVLENPPRDQVATVTPIEGRLDDPDADVWTSLGRLLRNAFVEAIRPGLEPGGTG